MLDDRGTAELRLLCEMARDRPRRYDMDAAWIPTKERQTRTIHADHFVMPLLIETLGPRKRKSRVDMAIEMSGG